MVLKKVHGSFLLLIQSNIKDSNRGEDVCRILSCVRKGRDLKRHTVAERRAKLGSFKLDLDSLGDTPHCISPLGQTWTRRSLLTLAQFDRQKMGEHFPKRGFHEPPVASTPPPPPLLTLPISCQFNPAD